VAFGVLVVDDNQSFSNAARLLLERQGACVVGVACTSAEAVRRVTELRPDVVLVDLALGDECGLDLARLIAGKGCGAPAVVLISAYSPADVEELLAGNPAVGFVPKSELSADAIRRAVRRSGRATDADALSAKGH